MQSSLSSLQAALQRDGMAGASQKSCLKEISLGLDLISRERVKPARKKRTDLPLSLHSLEDFQVPSEKLGKSFGLSRGSFIPHFFTPSTSTFMAPPGARSVSGASPHWRHIFPMVRLPVFLCCGKQPLGAIYVDRHFVPPFGFFSTSYALPRKITQNAKAIL